MSGLSAVSGCCTSTRLPQRAMASAPAAPSFISLDSTTATVRLDR